MPSQISIHALLAESDKITITVDEGTLISIHALLAESDVNEITYQRQIDQFLSTLSLRRATTWQRGSRVTYVISIHALLAESDYRQATDLFCQ